MRDIKYTGKVCAFCGKRIYFEANQRCYVDDKMNDVCSTYGSTPPCSTYGPGSNCYGLIIEELEHVPTTEVETA
jgi:hypothetical protein